MFLPPMLGDWGFTPGGGGGGGGWYPAPGTKYGMLLASSDSLAVDEPTSGFVVEISIAAEETTDIQHKDTNLNERIF